MSEQDEGQAPEAEKTFWNAFRSTAGERRLARMILALDHSLNRRLEKLMAVLDDFITAQQAFNADIAGDISTISGNIAALNAQIATLTAELAGAGLTPAQTQALADLTTAGAALQASADAAAGKTPPAAPAPAPAA